MRHMNPSRYSLVELQQGTPEWLEWRHNGIGASDAPIVMGENPWKSARELLREKCGPVIASKQNTAMAKGHALEPEARTRYEERRGISVRSACIQSNEYEWLRASVDGISYDGRVVVEIKCGESVYRHTSTYQKIPDYYYGQVQHVLAITGLTSLDFWCYLPLCTEVLLCVTRDDQYINRLLTTELEFWEYVLRKGTEGRSVSLEPSTRVQGKICECCRKKTNKITRIESGQQICASCLKELRPSRDKALATRASIDSLRSRGITVPDDLTRVRVKWIRTHTDLIRSYVNEVWYAATRRGIWQSGLDYEDVDTVCLKILAEYPEADALVNYQEHRQQIAKNEQQRRSYGVDTSSEGDDGARWFDCLPPLDSNSHRAYVHLLLQQAFPQRL